ncbi:MAG: molecular chaperone DnaJ [Gemmatimonadales bacterium]
MSDYYQTLGVFRDATEADIKKAYRKLAMEYHPDRNTSPEAEAKFKEISEAYQVLADPDKRAHYDRFGSAPSGGGGFGGGFEHIDLSEALNIFMRDFGGIGGFEGIFGGRGASAADVRRGQDVRVTVRLSLQEVATGATRNIKLKALSACEACAGTGAGKGTRPVTCGTCGGSGEVRRAARSMFGQFVQVGPCPTCRGEGTTVRTPCDVCRGEGRVKSERTVAVEIPAGVATNNYLTLRGQGAAGVRGGAPGDLQVIIEVKPDERFTRDGDDLWHDLPIAFSQAALGTEVMVPSPWGEERLEVPAGTQSGAVLSLKQKGLPRLGGSSIGALHVRVHVWTPRHLNDDQRRLFAELAEHEADGPDREGGFWSKLKEALGA